MEKEFGKIRKGDEETYSMLLLPVESNALKIHRKVSRFKQQKNERGNCPCIV